MRIPFALFLLMMAAASVAQQPRIDVIVPSRGPIAGGTLVTLRGANLSDAAVRLDRQLLVPLSRTSSEIQVQMPPHDNGFSVLSARNAGGIAYGEYLYVPPRLEDLPSGFITTIAGIGTYTRALGPALQANVNAGTLAFHAGNLYLGDTGGNRVYRIGSDGTIDVFAGTGLPGNDGDGGQAIDARVDYPRGIAFDGSGNAYIGGDRCELRRVAADGFITTVAGDGTCGFSGDGGLAKNARIASPTWMAADGEDLFFVDFTYVVEPGSGGPRDSVRIRRIHLSDGRISTVAGNGAVGYSGDGGPATQASFDFGIRSIDAGALALDPAGNIYVADAGNGRIRKIDRVTGIIDTFHRPQEGEVNWLTFDAAGNLHYAAGKRIARLNAQAQITASWGTAALAAVVPDGSPAATSVLSAGAFALDGAGNIIYSDTAINRVRRINTATELIESVAGIGPAILGEHGPAIESIFAATSGEGMDLALAPDGELLIADAPSFRLRALSRDGIVRTIGGTGGFFGSRSEGVAATEVSMYPIGVTIDTNGAIDLTNRSDLYRIDPNGLLFRNSHPDVSLCVLEGDGGPIRQARVCQPMDVLREASGALLIADTNNNRIRRVDPVSNIVTTIAGNGGPVSGFERYGFGSYCGDGGRAFDACLNAPWGVESDGEGNLYVSEVGRIRKIDAAGMITTLVQGNGYSKLLFRYGFLYAGTDRIDRDGNVTQIVGRNSQNPFLGDGGPAMNARTLVTGTAVGIAIDDEGNYFFADTGHRRIRAVRHGAVLAPPNATIDLTASGSVLRAMVRDGAGRPAPSVRVDFTVPASTCTLSKTFAITDAIGTASVSCTPRCISQTYEVSARAAGSAASDTLTLQTAGSPCRRRSVRR